LKKVPRCSTKKHPPASGSRRSRLRHRTKLFLRGFEDSTQQLGVQALAQGNAPAHRTRLQNATVEKKKGAAMGAELLEKSIEI